MSLPAFTLTTALAAAIAPAPAAEWRFHADAVLGTRLDIFVACASPVVAQTAADAAMAEIMRLDRLLSWRGGELARLNGVDQLAVSPELFEVLVRAAHWRAVSGGAFDERLGLATRLWREGDEAGARAAAASARTASVDLAPAGRIVSRGMGAVLDLDAIAKGYVIDRALAALRLAGPEITAAMVSIGGDMAGWRADPGSGAWRIGLPAVGEIADNTPLAAIVDLAQGAVATSGRGLRDVVVDGRRIGPAVSPHDGGPIAERVCATARAACAMDADALATIALVLPPEEALAIADATPDAALRITGADGRVQTSARWQDRQAPLAQFLPQTKPPANSGPQAIQRWPIDWRLAIWYRLPERRERDRDFREPYMAVWVTDANNKPVRTLFMVGQNAKWQKDNYIWWSGYRANAADIIDARSEATAPTGRYAFMWDGQDDSDRKVAAGKYTIHIETSRERGRHTHRTMDIEIGGEKFEKTMAPTPEEGGFTAVFGHYNDVRDYAPD